MRLRSRILIGLCSIGSELRAITFANSKVNDFRNVLPDMRRGNRAGKVKVICLFRQTWESHIGGDKCPQGQALFHKKYLISLSWDNTQK